MFHADSVGVKHSRCAFTLSPGGSYTLNNLGTDPTYSIGTSAAVAHVLP
nr:hypothetical protein [Armatimonas sp.]